MLKAGTIEFGGGALDCTVRNVSNAALQFASPVGIPAKFKLVIPCDGLRFACRVVWRKGLRVGVMFDLPSAQQPVVVRLVEVVQGTVSLCAQLRSPVRTAVCWNLQKDPHAALSQHSRSGRPPRFTKAQGAGLIVCDRWPNDVRL